MNTARPPNALASWSCRSRSTPACPRAPARTSDLSVLALDAHADLRDQYLDSRYNHACTLRRAMESAPVTQVGLRSASLEEAAFIDREGLSFLAPMAFRQAGPASVVDRLSEQVYVTVDLDSFDPS